MDLGQSATFGFFLLCFSALFSIINPLGGTFLFLAATQSLSRQTRAELARWVAIHSFIILTTSLYVGAYVLGFFGISLSVLRVAGGIVIALSGWQMLNAGEDPDRDEAQASLLNHSEASSLAFYPLTMPITTGPGTISVAISLGTSRPSGAGASQLAWFFAQATAATVLICLIVYLAYRFSDRISRAIGPTGTSIVVRLSAFLLFCIGIQVLWTGAAELLASVVGK